MRNSAKSVSNNLAASDIAVVAEVDGSTGEGFVQFKIKPDAIDFQRSDVLGFWLSEDSARALAKHLLDAVDKGIPSIRLINR